MQPDPSNLPYYNQEYLYCNTWRREQDHGKKQGEKTVVENNDITTNNMKTNILEKMLSRLIKKDTIPPPIMYLKGRSINDHIRKVTAYIRGLGLDDNDSKVAVIINSLEESVNWQLCAEPQFNTNLSKFDWIVEKLKQLYMVSKRRN